MNKIEINEDPFVMVEVDDIGDKPEPIVQKIDHTVDKNKRLFYVMREIAREHYYNYSDNSKIFYSQAVLMKDYTDDYNEKHLFTAYYPFYQKMSYEQLRTYFTWRTKVRNGVVEETSPSYSFVYVFELLNNIGVANPKEGMKRLLWFWKEFSKYHSDLDDYMVKWIKDYFIYYPNMGNFKKFAKQNGLQHYYPEIYVYNDSEVNWINYYKNLSSYNIDKSVFYRDENINLFSDCFDYVINNLKKICLKNDLFFEDFIFTKRKSYLHWKPFDSALFVAKLKQSNRFIAFSENEVYRCNQNVWFYKSLLVSEYGKRFIAYIIKETEAKVREHIKFKYKITANPNVCYDLTIKKFESIGVNFPSFIADTVAKYFADKNKVVVNINTSLLKNIRKEADEITEKLIVEDEEAVLEIPQEPEIIVPDENLSEWDNLRNILTKTELEALMIILDSKDFNAFCVDKNVLPEVVAEAINEKAFDIIGDTLMEYDLSAEIYEDYLEDITKMVRENG